MLGPEDTVTGGIHTLPALRGLMFQAKETDRYTHNTEPDDDRSMVGENKE